MRKRRLLPQGSRRRRRLDHFHAVDGNAALHLMMNSRRTMCELLMKSLKKFCIVGLYNKAAAGKKGKYFTAC